MRKVTWKVEIVIRATDERRVYHFANEGLARLALEWAYIAHLEALRTRADVERIEEEPAFNSGGWKDSSIKGRKLVWWQKHPKGFVAMKDYFTYERKVYRLPVCVGEIAPLP
jgi:hypothetical protein